MLCIVEEARHRHSYTPHTYKCAVSKKAASRMEVKLHMRHMMFPHQNPHLCPRTCCVAVAHCGGSQTLAAFSHLYSISLCSGYTSITHHCHLLLATTKTQRAESLCIHCLVYCLASQQSERVHAIQVRV